MRKMTKSEIIAAILAVVTALCTLSASTERKEKQTNAQSRPVNAVFKDHSPKPPAESIDTTPPLSAYEVVEILNSWYESEARRATDSEPAPET